MDDMMTSRTNKAGKPLLINANLPRSASNPGAKAIWISIEPHWFAKAEAQGGGLMGTNHWRSIVRSQQAPS
jgi:hypothetical protein